jgi:hypothetical protein
MGWAWRIGGIAEIDFYIHFPFPPFLAWGGVRAVRSPPGRHVNRSLGSEQNVDAKHPIR